MVEAVADELLAAFSVFRRAANPADSAPQEVVRSVELGEPSWGLNPALSRMVRTSEPARPMFLVPGDGLLGVYEPGGSGGVLSVDHAVTGENVGSAFRGTGRIEVSGLLPDTVGHVAVIRRNGEVIETSVPENVYAVIVDAAHRGHAAIARQVRPQRRGARHRGARCRRGIPDPAQPVQPLTRLSGGRCLASGEH